MKNFFLNQHDNPIIDIFSKGHIFIVLLTFLIISLIVVNKDFFVDMNDSKKKVIRYSLGIIIIANLILRRGIYIYFGVYNWQNNLDINFCNFTSILFLIYVFTNNERIYSICYYFSFIGPLLAILIPSVNLCPFNYSFYSFLILHHVIFIFNIMFLFINNYHFNRKDYKLVKAFLLIYLSVVYFFDYVLKTNYNMPKSFVNVKIFQNYYIQNLCNSNIISFIIFIIFIFGMLYLGKIILKRKFPQN